MGVEDYRLALLGLLPPGPAWPKDEGSPASLLFSGLAEEFLRVDEREDALIDEADPRTTYELLPDWERITGLAANAQSLTLTQRQRALVSKITSRGGQTPAYFISIVASLGYAATITEFSEFSVDSDVDAPLYDAAWAFAWQANLPLSLSASIDFTVDSDVDSFLAIYADTLDVKLVIKNKPAHTTVLFAFN